MSRFQAPKHGKKLSHIDAARLGTDQRAQPKNINFSFKYLLEDKDFHLDHGDVAYFRTAIRRFKGMCGMTKSELTSNRSSALRCHPINWLDTSRSSFGIPNEQDLCDEAYQFSISSNENGRVIGFFTGDDFNIVWFDKDHLLYQSKG